MNTPYLKCSMLGCAMLLLGACSSSSEIAMLREEVHHLKEDIQQARQQAGRAVEIARTLDLKTEMHAFMQRDEALAKTGTFPALENRIQQSAHSYSFLLRSDMSPRQPLGLFFKPESYLKIDFVSGSGSPDSTGNRLEVFSRPEVFDFEPMNRTKTEFNSYILEEGQALIVRTLSPSSPITQDGVPMSQVLFRYQPEGGENPFRIAYVRVTFISKSQANPTETAGTGALPSLSGLDDKE